MSNLRLHTLQGTRFPAQCSGPVLLLGDDASDIENSAEEMNAFGLRSQFVDESLEAIHGAMDSDADLDVMIIGKAFSQPELISYLETLRTDIQQARFRTVVQTRHQAAADRRRLIMSGASYLLIFPCETAVLYRVMRAALEDAAISDSIQTYVSSHQSGIGKIALGVFDFRTMDEAQKLASMIAMNYPSPEKVAIGIWELLCNAVEHGNLEIDFEQKALLLQSGRLAEEIRRRLHLPKYADRTARASFKYGRREIRLRITDQGPGFDYQKFLGNDPPVNTPNGRGIFTAQQLCFDQVRYKGRGNIAEAIVRIAAPIAENKISNP